MSDPFKKLVRGLIREAIIASSPPKPKKNKKKQKTEKKKRSRYISASTRVDVLRRDNYRCVFCGVSARKAELEVDHILPFSRGGSNKISNLQTLCKDCNRGKGNRFVG